MIRLFQVYMNESAKQNALAALESGYIGQGPRVEEFEDALAERMGVRPLTLNSCTSALDLALHLCEVGPGDHVVTTPQTCTATNGVIVRRGAYPIWADIDPSTGNIDPDDVGKRITARTKAIMAVDWGGRACDYAALRSYGLPIIEDAAHAFDTRIEGITGPEHVARSGGEYVCFSFQAIKHLTTGDGGAIVVPGHQVSRARDLRWYGLDRTSSKSFRCEQDITEVGYKYHMNDIAAAIGLGNLAHMDNVISLHRSHAQRYCEEIRSSHVRVPTFDPHSSWWIYSILVSDPTSFIAKMAALGIECSPVHARNDKHSAFRAAASHTEHAGSPLPGVDEFAAGHVAIPVGWWMSDDDVATVIRATQECAT